MMDALENSCLSASDLNMLLGESAVRERTPLSASIELTHRCNLRCVHCCHAPGSIPIESAGLEMPTSFWLEQIDALAERGCLNLLMTGGEPLLRPDFGKIYTHAKSKGLIVTVFTNGTLISEEHLDLFEEYPPRAVEITLYGATTGTCEAVTGSAEAFEATLRGIERLESRGIRIRLKTLLLTLNIHEFDDMRAMAGRLNVPFRVDAGIFPTLSGDASPTRYRVDPASAVATELALPHARENMADYFDRCHGRKASSRLYECAAGKISLSIDPCGELKPCLLSQETSFNLAEHDFDSAWEKIGRILTGKTRECDSDCYDCELKSLCGICPPFARLDGGTEQSRSDYRCALGKHRHMAITNQ